MEIAWAAGFFDGEGCIGFYDNGPRNRTLMLVVNQNYPAPLQRFLVALGCGKIYGPYIRRNTRHGPCWRYQVTGEKAAEAFRKLQPYLCDIKLEQGRLAIEAWQNRKSRFLSLRTPQMQT